LQLKNTAAGGEKGGMTRKGKDWIKEKKKARGTTLRKCQFSKTWSRLPAGAALAVGGRSVREESPGKETVGQKVRTL